MSTILTIAILGMLVASFIRGSGFGGRLLGAVIFIALLARVCQSLVPAIVLAALPLLVMVAAVWIIFFGVGRCEVR